MQISHCYDLVSVETMKFVLTVTGKYVIISVTTVVHVAARMQLLPFPTSWHVFGEKCQNNRN